MSEQGLSDALVERMARLSLRTLAIYASILIVASAALSVLSLRQTMGRTADVIESLLGLYADPGGARTPVAPAMLADQLVGVGSRFVITRRSDDDQGTRRTYFLTPDMPAKEIDGISSAAGDADISEVIQRALSARGWQYELLHRSVRSFDVFVATDRMPYVLGLLGISTAALALLPLGLGVARRSTRDTVAEALSPVERVREQIARIGPDSLELRLASPTGLRETSEIAATVNALLVRVERAQRGLASFTADASHELRTPLTYMRAQAQWALDGARSGDELREALAGVLVEADRMHRMLEGLLLLARGDSRELEARREVLLVAPLLAEVAEVGHGMAVGKPVTVEALASEALAVVGDQDHTRQILLNLVSNAVRHTATGRIVVQAEPDGESVDIVVSDTGVGMTPEELPRIFERFYRVEPSRSRAHGGAGLGLSIARLLAEFQGGTLTVQSRQGEGSRFTLRLPRAAAPRRDVVSDEVGRVPTTARS